MNCKRAVSRSGRTVTLRPVCAADNAMLFKWQHELGARTFTRNPIPPSRQQHEAWFNTRLSDGRGLFCVIMHGGEEAGVIRCDAAGADCYEVTILICLAHRGSGVATPALKLAVAELPNARIRAHVFRDNESSRRAFIAAGFNEIGSEWYEFRTPAETAKN